MPAAELTARAWKNSRMMPHFGSLKGYCAQERAECVWVDQTCHGPCSSLKVGARSRGKAMKPLLAPCSCCVPLHAAENLRNIDGSLCKLSSQRRGQEVDPAHVATQGRRKSSRAGFISFCQASAFTSSRGDIQCVRSWTSSVDNPGLALLSVFGLPARGTVRKQGWERVRGAAKRDRPGVL
jgi:hypothetical protein